jgi:hypothetical protein
MSGAGALVADEVIQRVAVVGDLHAAIGALDGAWLTPLPASGAPVTVSGGHALAQAPEHADVPALSASNK